MVLDDLGDRLHIGYLGHDGFRAEQLGYWQVDRGVFELVAPRTEVTDILEERTEYRRQVTAPHPAVASRPVTGPQPVTGPLTAAGPLTGPHEVVPPAGPSLAETARATRAAASYPAPEPEQPAGYGLPAAPASSNQDTAAYLPQAQGLPVPDSSTGVALPARDPGAAAAGSRGDARRVGGPTATPGGRERRRCGLADPGLSAPARRLSARRSAIRRRGPRRLSLSADSPLTASTATAPQVSRAPAPILLPRAPPMAPPSPPKPRTQPRQDRTSRPARGPAAPGGAAADGHRTAVRRPRQPRRDPGRLLRRRRGRRGRPVPGPDPARVRGLPLRWRRPA